MAKYRVIIMGAAGRDFHNFNVYFRHNPNYEVRAFTAAQIPNISGRRYPAILAGKLYPKGIPIYPEEDLLKLIKKENINQVFFAYSDVSYEYLMSRASAVMAAGADFILLGPKSTMLKSKKPVIAVSAVRTGCGKSQLTRYLAGILEKLGKKFVIIRHPMPYGNLAKQRCQRFATYRDLDEAECTIEEREEYEAHLEQGWIVYAGVDYEIILRQAELEAEVIIWDGGNNDFPFYKPDLMFVVADPHRPGHELSYYPGTINVHLAQVAVINKVDSVKIEAIKIVEKNLKFLNPKIKIIKSDSEIILEKPELIKGKKVLVIEDGPTLTHGEAKIGAGYLAAQRNKAIIISPKPYLVGSLKETFKKYSHLSDILPAMGYSQKQIKELEKTINQCPVEAVVSGTPIDLSRIIRVNKPIFRVRYELKPKGRYLEQIIKKFLKNKK